VSYQGGLDLQPSQRSVSTKFGPEVIMCKELSNTPSRTGTPYLAHYRSELYDLPSPSAHDILSSPLGT
jgi:hypothetical protein